MINPNQIIKKRIGLIKYRFLMQIIELLRYFTKHDLYIVAGQLHTNNTDPIDSWSFFNWLQQNKIRSCYVINSDNKYFLSRIKEKNTKNIVLLDGKKSKTQILHRIGMWIHARAYVTEWNIEIPFINEWMQKLNDMQYVMLQHGICSFWIDTQFIDSFKNFNYINVSSKAEMDLLETRMPIQMRERCFVGGLPRFDNLIDYSNTNTSEKILFVMFTWRSRPGLTWEQFKESYYWKGLLHFFSNENIERLKQINIKPVVSLHHSLRRILPDLQFHPHVNVVYSKDVRYWISHANCILTDFSSVAFDFLFLKKPAIFWIPDANDPTLNQDDFGYGSKVLSAKERQKNFFNTAQTIDEVFNLIENLAKKNFLLEEEELNIANKWIEIKSDFSKHVYDCIEERIK